MTNQLTERSAKEISERISSIDNREGNPRVRILLSYLPLHYAEKHFDSPLTKALWESTQRQNLLPPAESGRQHLSQVIWGIREADTEEEIETYLSILAEYAWLDGKDDLTKEINEHDGYPAAKAYIDAYGLDCS